MSGSFKDKHTTLSGKRKSRRHHDKSSLENEVLEDYKRFQIMFPNYCQENQYFAGIRIQDLIMPDDGESIVHEPKEGYPSVLYILSDMDHKLKKIIYKTRHDMDSNLMLALAQTLLNFPTLSIIKLDYCNLTADQILSLQGYLNVKKTVTELSLIGNPNKHQNFDLLMRCGLESLVLKFCEIDEKGLKRIAEEYLRYPSKDPISLVHLDLAHNRIFDEGCKYMATILRCDRTLKSLNLTDCKISDEGFSLLNCSFLKFSLDQDEINIRRKIRFDYFKLLQKVKNNSVHTLESDLLRETDDILKNHPYTGIESFSENGEIYCKGNYTLENINLSYNHLTKPSFDLLLKTRMEQCGTFGGDKGLQRIILEGNSPHDSSCDDVLTTIQELLSCRKLRRSSSLRSSIRGSIASAKSSGTNSIKSSREGDNRPASTIV